MNIGTFKKVLPTLLANNVTPFIWGSQGIGKTQTIKQYCKENDLGSVVLYTATQDVGDLIGLLVKDGAGSVEHAKPKWFPTEGKGIIFLDELNRAPNDVLQALFSFITEGKLHTHQLPPGWKVVAAGNYQNDKFNVTDTSDAAWMSRFCHIDFTPTVEEYLAYAEDRGMESVASFIRAQPTLLELSAKENGRLDTSFITPDRRAWTEGVGKLEMDGGLSDEAKYEVYSGLVGVAAAAAFISYCAKAEKSLSLNVILKNYAGKARNQVLKSVKNPKEVRFDALNQPIDELFVKLESNYELLANDVMIENLKMFLLDIPRELSMKAFIRMAKMPKFNGQHALLNDPEYVRKFA